MASRAPRVLLRLCGCTAKLYVSGQRCYVRLAAIRAVEMASYASLGAPLMLFFARHASPLRQSKTLSACLPIVSFYATRRLLVLHIPPPVACGMSGSTFVRGRQPNKAESIWLSRAWAKG